jgi:hypothetical protein
MRRLDRVCFGSTELSGFLTALHRAVRRTMCSSIHLLGSGVPRSCSAPCSATSLKLQPCLRQVAIAKPEHRLISFLCQPYTGGAIVLVLAGHASTPLVIHSIGVNEVVMTRFPVPTKGFEFHAAPRQKLLRTAGKTTGGQAPSSRVNS